MPISSHNLLLLLANTRFEVLVFSLKKEFLLRLLTFEVAFFFVLVVMKKYPLFVIHIKHSLQSEHWNSLREFHVSPYSSINSYIVGDVFFKFDINIFH
jgi:hypothetical protein